jgi:flagellar hook assembly protein FlgD
VHGRLVTTILAARVLPAGEHAVTWDGRDSAGRRAPAGAYFARLVTGESTGVEKLVLVR